MNSKSYGDFRVLRNVRTQSPNHIIETTNTYEFSFDELNDQEFSIEIRKVSFKVNSSSVKLGTAAKVIQEYTKVLSPLLFNVQQDSILLCNHEDVIERMKAKNEKLRLMPEYFIEENSDQEGDTNQYYIIDHIHDHFINLAKREGHEMAKHYLPIDYLKMVLFCIQKIKNVTTYSFPWKVGLFDHQVIWKGTKMFDPNLNMVLYTAEIEVDNQFKKKVKKTRAMFEDSLKIKINKNPITSNLTHKTEFINDGEDWDFSQTKIELQLGNLYKHHETVYISAINSKSE